MASIFDFFKTDYFGLPLYAWILIITVIILILRMGNKEKPFKRKNLQKELRKEFVEMEKNFSNSYSLSDKMELRKGFLKIGLIKRIFDYDYTFKEEKKKDKVEKRGRKPKGEEKEVSGEKGEGIKLTTDNIIELLKIDFKSVKKKEYDSFFKQFVCFLVFPNSLIGKIKMIFNFKGKYFLVDKEYITNSGNLIIIDDNAQYSNFFDIFIFSGIGKEIITDISYKIVREIELDEIVNFLPKQSYLETSISGIIGKYRELSKLEKERRGNEMEDLTKRET